MLIHQLDEHDKGLQDKTGFNRGMLTSYRETLNFLCNLGIDPISYCLFLAGFTGLD
jgi:hypothetical protein